MSQYLFDHDLSRLPAVVEVISDASIRVNPRLQTRREIGLNRQAVLSSGAS
jgi:hypothetical protein